jgi:diguanylate cyclase (GGDEF)-like protein
LQDLSLAGTCRRCANGSIGIRRLKCAAGKGWGTGQISSGTTISIVIAAVALFGLAALVALFASRHRPDPQRDDRLARAVDDMRSRMEDLGRDLSDALERAERESKRNRFLSDLGNSIEFEELLDRVLDAALEVPGFDAAMVVLDEAAGAQTLATRGMTPEEAANPPSSGGAGTLPAGPITVSYRYGTADAADAHLIRGGLFLPLVSRDGNALGSLALFWRTPGYEPSHERVSAVEQIAESCIPAIENARRYREARQLAETDALTGFFNQRYFHETLRREALRAQRYDRRLALLIIDLDDFKAVNDRIGHLAGDAVLAQLAERLRNEIRSVDIGCRVGGDEFAVIMPESTSQDASQLFQRMHESITNVSVPGGQKVRISAGIAELRHGETAAGLFERADSALYRAKETGKDRATVAKD